MMSSSAVHLGSGSIPISATSTNTAGGFDPQSPHFLHLYPGTFAQSEFGFHHIFSNEERLLAETSSVRCAPKGMLHRARRGDRTAMRRDQKGLK